MKKEDCRKADVTGAPYAGSGKLTDYKKDGSWMMNQMVYRSRAQAVCGRGGQDSLRIHQDNQGL